MKHTLATQPEISKVGRPRGGSLYWTKSGWRGRITLQVDGESVQKAFDLETRDRSVAKIKLRRLVLNTTAPEVLEALAKRCETFTEAV